MSSTVVVNGSGQSKNSLTNYVSYRTPNNKRPRIGHLDLDTNEITPLSYTSGTPLTNLYEVIEIGEGHIVAGGDPVALAEVKLLAPISGRDVLAVGKNYAVSSNVMLHFISSTDPIG